jgi:hypothetical protein
MIKYFERVNHFLEGSKGISPMRNVNYRTLVVFFTVLPFNLRG